MAELIYLLSAVMSLMCAVMLWRGYRTKKLRLLLWSSLCFSFVAANSILLFVDLVLFPDLYIYGPIIRQILGAAAGSLLLYGLIWELT